MRAIGQHYYEYKLFSDADRIASMCTDMAYGTAAKQQMPGWCVVPIRFGQGSQYGWLDNFTEVRLA